MKLNHYKFEILEEVVKGVPVYWVLRKMYFGKFHWCTQLIGKDNHGEIPFENYIEANNKLNECVKNN